MGFLLYRHEQKKSKYKRKADIRDLLLCLNFIYVVRAKEVLKLRNYNSVDSNEF
jgi:hypothetical protein